MKAIIFDLDFTLFDTEQYLKGAFCSISSYLSSKYPILKKDVYKTLYGMWNQKGSMHPYLFNDLLKSINIDEKELPNLINIYNNYQYVLNPYSDTIMVLSSLKKSGYKLGILTDGKPDRQKRKIELLNLKEYFDIIIYAKYISPKPSSSSYFNALQKLDLKGEDVLYVGDNPLLDFQGAKKAKMVSVRILRGEFSKIPTNEFIDYEINNLTEIEGIISHV